MANIANNASSSIIDGQTPTQYVTTVRMRARRSPSRTANVRLPCTRSASTSRRLLTISNAQDSKPACTAPTTPIVVTVPHSTNWVPSTATRPKNTNTNNSPSPA